VHCHVVLVYHYTSLRLAIHSIRPYIQLLGPLASLKDLSPITRSSRLYLTSILSLFSNVMLDLSARRSGCAFHLAPSRTSCNILEADFLASFSDCFTFGDAQGHQELAQEESPQKDSPRVFPPDFLRLTSEWTKCNPYAAQRHMGQKKLEYLPRYIKPFEPSLVSKSRFRKMFRM
jgi:hypothetical protein